MSRLPWIDVAKGLGIILVVYGHAVRGQTAAGLLPSTDAVMWQDHLIYAFHMPLFFFLSGLVSRQVDSHAAGRFLRGKLMAIVYPYALWSVVQGGLSMIAGSHANNPETFGSLASIAWRPIDQFWFLYILFLCQLTLLLPRIWLYILPPAGFLVATHFEVTSILARAVYALPYFAAGAILTAQPVARWLQDRRAAIALTLFAWGSFALLAIWPAGGVVGRYALAVVGIGGMLGLAFALADRAPILAKLGEASMAIYLAHVIISAAARTVTAGWAMEFPGFALVFVTIAGLLGPYVLYMLARHHGWLTLLGFGRDRTRTV
ncbi:acyltransferase family protein [uncultured Sphingomonas sp.]|uniref:acyltransferase family protein n=1 Tax=uncultured Sphingomonas sp. TaxID=158754 RepID=UPI0025DAE40F|nr:acyltransferase family protein [uncultured Sphingomonas sp.]